MAIHQPDGEGSKDRPGDGQGEEQTQLIEQINTLAVDDEHTSGYDRGNFGDYDRAGARILDQSQYPAHDGHNFGTDDNCHPRADDVHSGPIVPLAEAWASGAHSWAGIHLDQFAADADNFAVMTDGLHKAKSDDDPADGLPPHTTARCDYAAAWIRVKLDYSLSIDQAEKQELLDIGGTC